MAKWIRTTGEKFFRERQEKLDAANFETDVEIISHNLVAELPNGELYEGKYYEDATNPSELRRKHIIRYKLKVFTHSSQYSNEPKRVLEDFYSYYEDAQPRAWYFTFGQGHYDREGNPLKNCYTMISARSSEEARFKMWKWWGEKWANQYDTAEAAGVHEYNLKLII